ncbi:Signal transduction response regulator [Macleaya cordata]|uniref:Signal transduction response regulator n=1 Tax=Macleaya cordata TaxID=56857 RepID=A0A200QEU3_MACCD|nr:Signal transduction response regulator [Macleaya cordata]
MEYKEESFLVKDSGGSGSNSVPFLDRSKVRILLCDNDAKSCEEVFSLLCKCSYQVTSVRTARQVIDALNADGSSIDIILTEVDLPIGKGLKLLKYIMRDKEFHRIPIIMMSAQDEVSVVVKCLKLGAADYLVKPLRTNELLNLWTHMWRRRNMLGLAEKNILNCDFDLVESDPSDANTNSTTIFSDDTDDKSHRKAVPDMSVSNHRQGESEVTASLKPPAQNSLEPDVPSATDQRMGKISSRPRKSELKVGESSAFFTYVKSSLPTSNPLRIGCREEKVIESEQPSREEKLPTRGEQLGNDADRHEHSEAWDIYSCENGVPSSNGAGTTSSEAICNPPPSLEFPQRRNSKEEDSSTVLSHRSNKAQVDAPGVPAVAPFPYYLPGMMNQVMMPSSTHLYQGNLHDFPKHPSSAMLPPYHPLPQGPPHASMMASFPYYPLHMCMQQGQMPATHVWPSIARSSSTEVKPSRVERREAALIKFRQKRKDRCFDKKIRYVNRKRLAERRPRVRGQFVRQVNGVDFDLNGQPVTVDDSDDDVEEDVDDELVSRDSCPGG